MENVLYNLVKINNSAIYVFEKHIQIKSVNSELYSFSKEDLIKELQYINWDTSSQVLQTLFEFFKNLFLLNNFEDKKFIQSFRNYYLGSVLELAVYVRWAEERNKNQVNRENIVFVSDMFKLKRGIFLLTEKSIQKQIKTSGLFGKDIDAYLLMNQYFLPLYTQITNELNALIQESGVNNTASVIKAIGLFMEPKNYLEELRQLTSRFYYNRYDLISFLEVYNIRASSSMLFASAIFIFSFFTLIYTYFISLLIVFIVLPYCLFKLCSWPNLLTSYWIKILYFFTLVVLGWFSMLPFSNDIWNLHYELLNHKINFIFFALLLLVAEMSYLTTILKRISPKMSFSRILCNYILFAALVSPMVFAIGLIFLNLGFTTVKDSRKTYSNDPAVTLAFEKTFGTGNEQVSDLMVQNHVTIQIDTLDSTRISGIQMHPESLAISVKRKTEEAASVPEAFSLDTLLQREKELAKKKGIFIPIIYKNKLGYFEYYVFPYLLLLGTVVSFFVGFLINFISSSNRED